MKYVLSLIVLGVVVITGCQKNYTCYCGDKNNDIRTPVIEMHDTKKNAEAQCQAYRDNIYAYSDLVCEIK